MTPQDLMMLSMQQRIEYIAPLIQKYESPISVPVRIAQAIQESTIFTSELALKTNNGFGIKASAPWTGVTHPHVSGEHKNGKNVKEKSLFRKYPNIEASVKDHAAFFTSTEFRKSDTAYGLAIKATTYEEEAKNLGPKFPGDKSSYAGDPNYASSLLKHIKNYNLAKYDTKNIEKENAPMAKVLLIAGHGLNKNNGYYDTGAVGYVGKGEHAYFRDDIFQAMKKFLPKGADVVFHTQYNVYSHNNLVSLARSYGSDTIVVECHFDAGGTAYSKAGGHVIIHSSFQPDALDLRIRDAIKKTAGLHPHYKDGISKRNNLRNVTSAANGGINYRLIELGMSTHRENGLYLKNNVDTLAKALVEAIWGTSDNTTKPVESTQSSNNPQGLETTKIPTYTAPKLPFDRLEKGAKVTFRDPWNWYDDSKKEFIHSKKHDELKGTQFTIEEVKEIDAIGYSKVAYKSAEHNSWILEQDIIEARDSWKVVEVEPDEKQDVEELQEGQFWLDDKLYQVAEIKK